MKKSSFVAVMLGTVSGMLFALGMCMALIPEWATFYRNFVGYCYNRSRSFLWADLLFTNHNLSNATSSPKQSSRSKHYF